MLRCLTLLFLAGWVLLAADSPELLIAIRNGDHAQVNKLLRTGANVNAMDSQSFMDHSTDIANAVREAMLNMHPINGVVASL